MPVYDFQVPVGSWARDLSPKARDQIGKEVPQVPVERVASATVNYCLRRDAAKDQPASHPAPKEARALLKDLAKQARQMRVALESETFSAVRSTCNQTAVAHAASPTLCRDLRAALGTAAIVFEHTAKRIPPGPWMTPGERLIGELVHILQETGLTVDARPNGNLCLLLDIIANDIGENSAGFVKMAKRRLSKRDKPDRK